MTTTTLSPYSISSITTSYKSILDNYYASSTDYWYSSPPQTVWLYLDAYKSPNQPKVQAPSWPICDLYTTKDGSYVLEIAAPKRTKDDFDIERENNSIRIKVRDVDKSDERLYLYKKIRSDGFDETFTFPEDCDMDSIQISLDGGVMKLTVPVKEEKKPIVKKLTIE